MTTTKTSINKQEKTAQNPHGAGRPAAGVNPLKLYAYHYHLAGETNLRIGKIFGKSHTTVGTWINEVHAMLEETPEYQEAAGRLAAMLPVAAKVLHMHLLNPTSPKNFEAAIQVLRGLTVLRDKKEIDLTLHDMDDNELIGGLGEALGLGAGDTEQDSEVSTGTTEKED